MRLRRFVLRAIRRPKGAPQRSEGLGRWQVVPLKKLARV